jgi:hypothetical protein
MKIHLIVGHRVENYPGEYCPEVLDAGDEYSNDENPVWIIDKLAEQRATKEFEAVDVITVELPVAVIMSRLYPQHQAIPVSVLPKP